MKRNILLALIVLLYSSASIAQNNEPAKKSHKVVFQLASDDSVVHMSVMKQLNNLLASVPDVTVEVVCHGPGINMLVSEKTTVRSKIQQLKARGVVFAACENTMKDKNITKDKIIAEASFVPAAIVELMNRQEEGWTYIKAGF